MFHVLADNYSNGYNGEHQFITRVVSVEIMRICYASMFSHFESWMPRVLCMILKDWCKRRVAIIQLSLHAMNVNEIE